MTQLRQRELVLLATLIIILQFTTDHTDPPAELPKRIRSTSSIKAPVGMKRARWDYFHRMLRDPATDQIPPGIREKEMTFARMLKRMRQGTEDTLFTWSEVGPVDLGGRTRALAVDVNNSDVVIAGGVSGGIWKTTDAGETWIAKSDPSQNLSVSSLVQDTRPGQTNIWYYATGEFVGNSASDLGKRSPFFGAGLFKSTDNGETWERLSDPWGRNSTIWDSPLDFVSRIVVSPATGSIFLASNGVGIYRSSDQGNTFDLVLGGVNDHFYSDVVMGPEGRLVAVLSQFAHNSDPAYSPGVYRSDDNGGRWIDITPSTFPTVHERSVLALAPSNPDILYVLTFTGDIDQDDRDDIRFHKINVSTGASEDRSGNMPDFGDEGFVHTQYNYNMVLSVKPDDEDFVIIGATSLFRSRDGFATESHNIYDTWFGGYEPGNAPHHYPNLHPDQHVIVFDPANGNRAWIGHDGGLSVASNITRSSSSTFFFPWINKNNGYNVVQFYTIAISDEADDRRIMGGTQDNGTPFFTWDGTSPGPSQDVSSGDGGFAFFGDEYAYTSSHNGRVLRLNYDRSGHPSYSSGWTAVTPEGSANRLFITPYAVDRNNEDVMYYAAGNTLWRNNNLSAIPQGEDSTSVGWSQLTNLTAPADYLISAITASRYNPKHLLYYGASSSTGSPKLYRLEKAHTATEGKEDISVALTSAGAYVHDIAINPVDGDEILVVLSNYNIVGLYHSSDGGREYQPVEGNLAVPSLRSAAILPVDEGVVYLLATSTGVYSTMQLDGPSTLWKQEGQNEIGNVVAARIAARTSDGLAAVGTHGRGVFMGNLGSALHPGLPSSFSLGQNFPNPFNRTTSIPYHLPKPAQVKITIFNVEGQEIETVVDEFKMAGSHLSVWNAGRASSGIYFYRMTAEDFTETGKCILAK